MTPGSPYTKGPVFKHIRELALTSAVGLFAIFIVDLVDMFFISLLGEPQLAAAVGFAGLGLFLGASVCIGLSVAVATLVSQAIGEYGSQHNNTTKDNTADEDNKNQLGPEAKRLATHGLLYSLCWTIPITLLTLVYAEKLLQLFGAQGEVLAMSASYFRIVGVTLPVLGIAFIANSLLRSVGAARMSMWTTLWGGIVNAIFDPIFIFGFGLGLTGAALASVLSRFTIAGIALYDITKKYNLFTIPRYGKFYNDVKTFNSIALPSILTNLSAPLSSAFATAQMAKFGTEAVAAASVIGRITPVLFAGLYGLSGAIGPVASQNFGAKEMHRVHETLFAGARFVIIYVVPVTILMFFLHEKLSDIFSLGESASELLRFYSVFIVGSYLLFGLQLTANPMFTALRHPGYGTVSNIFRDLAMAIPLIALFSSMYGAKGVLAGQALANAIAGIVAFAVAHWLAGRVENGKSIDLKWSSLHLNHHTHVIPGINHRGH